MSMHCCASALVGADVYQSESMSGSLDLRRESGIGGVFGHTCADDVNDLAFVARELLVQKSEIRSFQRLNVSCAFALHPFDRYFGERFRAQPRIDDRHNSPLF